MTAPLRLRTNDVERGYLFGRQVEKVKQEKKHATRDRLLRTLVTEPEGSREHEAAFVEARALLGIVEVVR